MSVFEIKRGDRKVALAYRTTDYESGSAVFSGCTARFRMMLNGVTRVDAAAIIRDEDGELAYEWQAGDTDAAGACDAEFVVTWPDGKELTYPSSGFIAVLVSGDVPALP